MAAGGRVSIPAGVRRTIADIKEITGGHGDEEVYAMLRECNMDPNETAQKLLLQDTFHEVKSKRDKKKEGNKEPSDSRWRPVMQGRGGKGVRVNNSSRHLAITTDAGGRIAISGKENEVKKNLCAVGDMPRSDSISLVDPRADPPSEEGATAVGSNVPQSLKPPASVLVSCTSVSDPVLVLSSKSHSLGDVGVAKQAIGTHWTAREHNAVCCELPMDNKGTSLSSASLSFGRSSGSRPSSSYSNRSQQSSSSQKVVPNKEWKPKSTSITAAQATEVVIVPDDVPLIAETVGQSAAPISNSVSKEDLLKVDKKFNDLSLPDRQHVIIPEHLQVSESEKYGLTFGSFSTGFHQTMGSSTPECADSSSPPEYGLSQKLNDIDDESMPGDQNSSSTVPEAADPDPQLLLAEKLETSSPLEVENPSSPHEVAGSNQCRDASATSGIPRSSIVQTTPPYSAFELSPQIHGNQISSLETSQSQGHNSSLLSSSGSAPLAIPAAGVVPTSIAIPQQSVPVFRQPVGVHLPYYPQNYIPYNQYISPYFIPPPTIYPFLGNTAFTQPSSTGPMYPAPGSAAVVPPVKYSAPSFKPANNTGSQLNQASVGIPGAYGTYGSNPSVYTDNMPLSNGNPAENDDATSSQFKENSIYIAGQQSEGSTMWIPALGQDMPGLQASSFYGLPPQGQHIKFAPGQAPHSPFGGIYHPSQTMGGGTMHPLFQPSQTMAGAVELTGPPGSIYQQQQTQMNWGHYC